MSVAATTEARLPEKLDLGAFLPTIVGIFVGTFVKSSLHMWKSYLKEVREEVHLGVGIFSEDEHLRSLLQECFEVGDAINGVVYWDRIPSGSRSNERSSCDKSDISPVSAHCSKQWPFNDIMTDLEKRRID
jgi:hypothetical protein